MKFRLGLFVFILVLCMTTVGFTQPGGLSLNLYGSGARAAGMGYAFTGVADDATAISWNPAGLTQLMSMEASVVGKFSFGSLSTDYSEFNPTTEIGSSFNLNFASFVMPFKAGNFNLVGGVAYRRIFNFTEKQTIKIDDNIQGIDVVSEMVNDNKGGVDAISPALGFQINDMISVGATFNILMGSTDYKYKEYLEVGGFVYSDIEGDYSEDYSGTAIDLGVLIKPSPQFSLGAAFKLPYTLTVEEDGDEVDVDIPMFMDFGAAFRASDNLTIAADYRLRPLDKIEVEGESVYEDVDITGNSFHVGLEYLMQAGQNPMPIRLGYFTFPTTQFDVNDDQVTFNGVSAGLGLLMGNFILDGAFEWVFGSFPGDTENGDDVNYSYNDFRVTVGAVIHLGGN